MIRQTHVQGPMPKLGESAGTKHTFKPNFFDKNMKLMMKMKNRCKEEDE